MHQSRGGRSRCRPHSIQRQALIEWQLFVVLVCAKFIFPFVPTCCNRDKPVVYGGICSIDLDRRRCLTMKIADAEKAEDQNRSDRRGSFSRRATPTARRRGTAVWPLNRPDDTTLHMAARFVKISDNYTIYNFQNEKLNTYHTMDAVQAAVNNDTATSSSPPRAGPRTSQQVARSPTNIFCAARNGRHQPPGRRCGRVRPGVGVRSRFTDSIDIIHSA